MKKPKQSFRNRLVAVFAIFIALTMIVSTIPAMDISKSNTNEFSAVETTALTNFDTEPGIIVPSSDRMDELAFYDPATVNASALGLTGAAPFINWGVAIRLTPAELGPYNGGNLTGARFYYRHSVNLSGPYAAGHGGNLTIFDEGTASTPGAQLAQETWYADDHGWVNITLTTPIEIAGTSDIWVHFEGNTWYEEWIFGLDGGPALQGKGDMAKLPSGTWLSLGGAGIDRNVCIGAFVEGGSGEITDIALTDIVKPTSETAGIITPEVTIDNLGTTTPTDVAVNMEINRIDDPTTIGTEDFSTYVAPVDLFPPAGWSIIQYDPTATWYKYSSGYARCTENGATGAQDEYLITESFDFSGYTDAAVGWGYHYQGTFDDDWVQFLGSIDGGATWPYLIANFSGGYTSGARSYDISSWAAGQSNVKFTWRFVSGAYNGGNDYFYFNQFKVSVPAVLQTGITEDFNSWGPYGDNPPTGWSIYDYGSESPPVWNYNDWHLYYYSSFASNCARVYYYPDYESMDEWLITPTLDCTSLTNVDLMFRQYFYFYYLYPGYGIIEGSTDNGATWPHLVVNQTSSQSSGYYSFDLSSWAAGESQVKIRFRYLAPGAYGRYWYLDDVIFGDISDEVILFENYWFDDQTPQVWPTGWFVVDWDGEGIEFEGSDSSTYAPTGSSGYYGFIKDPSGASVSESLVSPSYDMTGMTSVRIQFDHKFDKWLDYDDYVAVEIYSGGYFMEEIQTWDYDVDEHVDFIFDPSIYWFPNDIRIGLYYYDGGAYAEEWAVDNVVIQEIPLVNEYTETVYVDIETDGAAFGAGLASQVVELPPWIPDDWQVTSNDYVEYQVTASIAHGDDVNPDNDALGPVTIALVYPFVNDLGMEEIVSPGEDMPAQTFPVEITVENDGQFPAEGFTATVEILEVGSLGTCDYEVWLYDSYGDGWNGGSMDVFVDGDLVLDDITVASGSGPVVYPFTVGDGSSIFMDWTAGSWPGENYFDVYDSEATLIEDDWYPYYDGDWSGIASCPGGGPSGGTVEYSETITNVDEFDPDEILTLEFPDWTPAGIAAGESGPRNYTVVATVSYNPDMNADNDAMNQSFTLEYFHDIEVKEITQPSAGDRADVEIGYSDGHTENAYAWVSGAPWTIAMELSDPELAAYRDYDLTEVTFSAGCDDYGFYVVDYDIYYAIGSLPDIATLTPIASGQSSGTGWDTITVPAQEMPDTGSAFVIVKYSNYGGGFPAGFDYDNGDTRGQHMLDLDTTNTWIHLQDLWGAPAVWGLEAGLSLGSGPGSGDVFLQPGTYPFAAMTANIGTFPETGLTANAKLFAFNETGDPYLIYEENYTDFDLDISEEEEATFGSYTFVDNGIYELDINLPLATDDFIDNNFEKIFIGIDSVAPISEHALDPAAPTGANGWYISDVTVTLTAEDGEEDWQSGVDFIEYRIDGGAWQTGDTFVISTNGMHTIDYRATDNVGNVEDPNSFDIDMDQDGPTIDLTWEAGQGKNEIIFTATCSDADSGMDYVEFYINDVLQLTATSAPYTFTMVHGAGTKYTVKAIAYDLAGLSDFDEIGSGEGLNSINVHTVPNPLIK